MPEQPIPKLRPLGTLAPADQRPITSNPHAGYAELHCLTNYSFLQAASHPDELVRRAAELNYCALSITDRHSLAGVVRAHAAAKPLGLRLMIGTEISLEQGSRVVLHAKTRRGYAGLARLLTVGKRRAPKGECHLKFADVAQHSSDLLASIPLDSENLEQQAEDLPQWRELFGDDCSLMAQRHHGPHDDWTLQRFVQVSNHSRITLVASNGVQFHDSSRRFLQDVQTAIRLGRSVAELGSHRLANGERHLKSADQMRQLFAACPMAIERTVELADRCTFSLDELKYEYPEELCPRGETPLSWLKALTKKGLRERYPNDIPPLIQNAVDHELRLIEELHYEAYFLTVWDLVRFARSREILCQGRGSAANSAVCYCLGITSVDPGKIDLLFERFISRERGEAPDIDVDFEHERREEVLQYLYDKYGRERAGMTAEVISYRPKSAVRDVGKALGLSLDCIDALAKSVDHAHHDDARLVERFRSVGFDPDSRVGRQLVSLVDQLLGFPRHLSQHVGGMIITKGPLCELVPIENAAMADRTVVEWDKDDLDELGILKVDCLALGMLTAIRKSFDFIKQHTGHQFTLANLPPEDTAVYDMLCRAESIGVFQVESRAQMSMLPRLKPICFYDLVVEVAIVRPGPIQGKMVHPYLRRRDKLEDVTYPSEAVRHVLEKTLGVPIFQEQAMKLAIVAAGFTPGEADQLRRAMGAWRRTGVMGPFRDKLIGGMVSREYSPEFAERVYEQIQGFGEYGFPESHAASFALLVYASAWLKHYQPAIFTAALLNSQPLGFYAPAQLVAEARRQGVDVRPADVNLSDWDCTIELHPYEPHEPIPDLREPGLVPGNREGRFAIRLGLRMIHGLRQDSAERIMDERRTEPFSQQAEFARRTSLRRGELTLLANAGAFGSLQPQRRTSIWDALPVREPSPLYDESDEGEPTPDLAPMTAIQEVVADYQSAGLSLRAHPLSFLRPDLELRSVVRAVDLLILEPDRRYRVAGLVLLRQRPSTAKGITFMTIEDETGTANLVVHVNVWERFRLIARRASAIIARGVLERQNEVVHLVVDTFEDLTDVLSHYKNPSRDFR
ncbi:error-prone DNA polymerase [Schlesneria paludicola]|uniref:error-prone DNA polymerase n=1 Tax=Schlesneria paludicola TaxID=360056 RepID=UPI00029A848F|nr:error-prone DNA polymerase [Schlesneria paludicola]